MHKFLDNVKMAIDCVLAIVLGITAAVWIIVELSK